MAAEQKQQSSSYLVALYGEHASTQYVSSLLRTSQLAFEIGTTKISLSILDYAGFVVIFYRTLIV